MRDEAKCDAQAEMKRPVFAGEHSATATHRLQAQIITFSPDDNQRYPICLIISPANSLHFTSFAPSINRAKSYVTVFAAIALSNPLRISSAASFHPMYSSIITPERITDPGFTLS